MLGMSLTGVCALALYNHKNNPPHIAAMAQALCKITLQNAHKLQKSIIKARYDLH